MAFVKPDKFTHSVKMVFIAHFCQYSYTFIPIGGALANEGSAGGSSNV